MDGIRGDLASGGFGFQDMIAPIDSTTFFADYYERRHVVLHRQDSGYYARLLDLDTVWRHIETHPLAADEMNMVKFGCDQVAANYLGTEQRADPRRMLQMFDDGWTIALNKMQNHVPALAALCQAAEALFSSRFQTNLYLTPPNAQGFKAHWDTHDVFVLQVHGSKAWSIYDTKIEMPLLGQGFNHQQQEPGPVAHEFILRAGDMLYCPRGLMHAAQSADETSLHITFGLMSKTWAELMVEAVSNAALSNPKFRHNLPTGYARDDSDPAAIAAIFADLLASLPGSVDFPAVIGQMRDQFIMGRLPAIPGQARQIAALDRLTAASLCGVRPNPIFHLAVTDDSLTVEFGSNTLTLPGFTEPTVSHALAHASYQIHDLPGPLDDDSKVTLVRRLIREGLVVAHGV